MRTLRKAPALLGLGLALLLAVGCAAPQKSGRIRSLGDTVFRLNHAYRWKDFATVRKMLDPAQVAEFDRRFVEPGDDLVIVDTEVGEVDVPEKEALSATLQLTLKWYLLPSISVTTTRLRCTLHNKDGRWLLIRQEEVGKEGTGPLDLP